MKPPSSAPPPTESAKGKHAATISGWDEALRFLGVLVVGIVIW